MTLPHPASPAIFLDRDGVINQNRSDYVKSWAEFVFLPGALDALAQLATLGLPIVVLTNQSPIARGLLAETTLQEMHRRMVDEIQSRGGRIDGVYYCPHHPNAHCACRKPQPGMLLRAGAERNLDLSRSVFIGDSASDMEAGQSAGCRGILLRTGRGAEHASQVASQWPQVPIVADLAAAIPWVQILA